MRIIKAGRPKRAIARFECRECGCVFEAERCEYRIETDYRNGHYYVCPCPTCGKDVIRYPEEVERK